MTDRGVDFLKRIFAAVLSLLCLLQLSACYSEEATQQASQKPAQSAEPTNTSPMLSAIDSIPEANTYLYVDKNGNLVLSSNGHTGTIMLSSAPLNTNSPPAGWSADGFSISLLFAGQPTHRWEVSLGVINADDTRLTAIHRLRSMFWSMQG